MKKLIVTLGAMMVAAGVFAQGYVNVLNTAGYAYSTNSATWSPSGNVTAVGSAAAGEAAGTTAYIFAILTESYSGSITTDTNVWDGTWTFTGAYLTNKANGQPGVITAQQPVQVGSWANNTTQQVVIVGWSASLTNTWAGISSLMASGFAGNSTAGFVGVSSVGDIMAVPLGGPYGSIWTTAAAAAQPGFGNAIGGGFNMFAVPISVPEPATVALAGLGGLSLLLFRRQRK